jgi:hypothetical protein
MASARAFHGRCDGHAPTLTLIQDTTANFFGGFTPVEWKSVGLWTADRSLKTFLFTLKNPHNFPAKKFALKDEKKGWAILCDSSRGPVFGEDICVSDNYNADTHLGDCHANDTGLYGRTFLTGFQDFTVREIEVFEITD